MESYFRGLLAGFSGFVFAALPFLSCIGAGCAAPGTPLSAEQMQAKSAAFNATIDTMVQAAKETKSIVVIHAQVSDPSFQMQQNFGFSGLEGEAYLIMNPAANEPIGGGK